MAEESSSSYGNSIKPKKIITRLKGIIKAQKLKNIKP